jgi:soluble lytic murein transglycosylase-like protein
LTSLANRPYPPGMRVIVRSLAVLTVLSGIVVVGLLARAPRSTPQEAVRTAASQPGPPRPLPPDWTARVLKCSREVFPGSPRLQTASVMPLVRRYAARFDVDPLTILAVIQVESQFDPKAVSSAGAIGLMQLQPATARALAADLGLQWSGDDLLYDPDVNVMLGTYYLRNLFDRFGDPDAALAAYCSGPTLVEARRGIAASSVPLGYSDRVWDVLTNLQAVTSL